MGKLFDHAPVDAAVDQLGKKLMFDALPPALEVGNQPCKSYSGFAILNLFYADRKIGRIFQEWGSGSLASLNRILFIIQSLSNTLQQYNNQRI